MLWRAILVYDFSWVVKWIRWLNKDKMKVEPVLHNRQLLAIWFEGLSKSNSFDFLILFWAFVHFSVSEEQLVIAITWWVYLIYLKWIMYSQGIHQYGKCWTVTYRKLTSTINLRLRLAGPTKGQQFLSQGLDNIENYIVSYDLERNCPGDTFNIADYF
jgi:hypothetical protein